MIKVIFIQSISTVGDSYAVGDKTSLEPGLAASWIKAGICESLEPVKTPTQLKADKAAADKAAADKAAADKAAADKAAADKAAADDLS